MWQTPKSLHLLIWTHGRKLCKQIIIYGLEIAPIRYWRKVIECGSNLTYVYSAPQSYDSGTFATFHTLLVLVIVFFLWGV